MAYIDILSSPSGIQLSDSPMVFKMRINPTSSLWTQDTRQAAVIRMKHGSDTVSEIDVQFEGTIDVDVSDMIAGWFRQKQYDCSTLDRLKDSVSVETFTMEVDYKCKRTDTDYHNTVVHLVQEPVPSCTTTISALEGGLSEYAVFMLQLARLNDADYVSTCDHSFKPFSVEAVNYGESPYPLASGRTYYAEEEHNPLRHRFFFINSNGRLESASLVMRETLNAKTSTTVHKMYKEASLAYTPHVSSDKKSHITYQMSSGYCTREWAEWWAGEFAFAKHYWMEAEDGSIIPVSISMETATAYNKSNEELPHIDFEVNL